MRKTHDIRVLLALRQFVPLAEGVGPNWSLHSHRTGLHLLARHPAPTPDGQEAVPDHPNFKAHKPLLPGPLLATGTSIWPRRRCDGERN
jgi:hypothetical protein